MKAAAFLVSPVAKVLLANPVVPVALVFLVLRDSQVAHRQSATSPQSRRVVNAHLAHLETLVLLENLEIPVHLVNQAVLETTDHPDLLDLKDHPAKLDSPDVMERVVSLVDLLFPLQLCLVILDSLVIRDLPVFLESLDNLAVMVNLVHLVLRARQDLPDHLVSPAVLEIPDLKAHLVSKESVVSVQNIARLMVVSSSKTAPAGSKRRCDLIPLNQQDNESNAIVMLCSMTTLFTCIHRRFCIETHLYF